jgi:IS30 family transposase
MSQRKIALRMNRSASTLSREIKRNKTEEGYYLPDQAHEKMQKRRKNAKKRFNISLETLEEIKRRLRQYHSPEQIVGRMKKEGLASISHETLYQMVYSNYEELGEYKKYLRQKRKQRRRKGSKQERGIISGRVGIEKRPAIANEKIELGHWESDTVIGANHEGAIVTHVDKASKFLLASLIKSKTAEQVFQATIKLFSGLSSEQKKTMTSDNGKEFSKHEDMARELGVSHYFANPYHSWERGLNEHTNGMLRQFFPKGTNFKIAKPEELQKAVDMLNNRPRKSLDYRTPFEVFYSQSPAPVALHI